MRDLIPGLGDRKTRERLDELFNRQTLGSVVFGGHLNKLFEKIYNLIALTVVLVVLGVDVGTATLVACSLFVVWSLGMVIVVYVFVKWERVMNAAQDAAESAQEYTEREE